MNFDKIINSSIDETVKSILENTNADLPVIEDANIEFLSKQDKILMDYSNILLKNYHQELKRELANHGIQL